MRTALWPLPIGYSLLFSLVAAVSTMAQSTSQEKDVMEVNKGYTTAANATPTPTVVATGTAPAATVATTNNHYDSPEEITKPIPHPYVYFGPSLMPDGYAPLAYRVEAGLDIESTHALLIASAAYDDGHKTNDGDQPNPSGHDRYLQTAAYYRMARGWFFGMGWNWSQLSTTNYTKSGTRPKIGGGYDLSFQHPCEGCSLSMRINFDWVMAGTDWQNGSHGPNIAVTFPRPIEKRHVFFVTRVGVYRYHTTVTEPDNLSLTRWQREQHSIDSDCNLGLIYRF